MSTEQILRLAAWQQEFVERFLMAQNIKSLLVAAPGTGKTMTALYAANKLLEQGSVDSLLVISDRLDLRDQWAHAAKRYGLDLETALERHLMKRGVSATLQSLRKKEAESTVEEAARTRRWLIVADDPAYESKSLVSLVDRMLSFNERSRALFISGHVPTNLSVDAEFRFGSELIFERSIIEAPETEIRIARYAPSFSLLRKLQKGRLGAIDAMSWREFEKLIATLLEKDGYVVELMNGTKDGGVDVVAVRDLGPTGYFKALWQAKKQAPSNKVGLSVIRELADVRQEVGASKGVIVTSSYLTRGALERISRDKYLLGKVERDELDVWVRRTLFCE